MDMNSSHLKPATVDDIDRARREYFERDPDRADARCVRKRSRDTKDVTKAKTRYRTAAWRSQNDKLKRPEGATAALQFLLSTVAVARLAGRSELAVFAESEAAFQHALDELESKGFDRDECKAVFKRLTKRTDRKSCAAGEKTEC
jgi:hypothetical protein